MFQKVSTDMDFAARELKVLELWKEKGIVEKSFSRNQGRPAFTLYDGPPTANGRPHIGHVITRAYKDIIPRYKVMKGYHVLRKAGWDTHGLPVELEVEKQLGINGKPQIEKYGIEPFIKACKASVWKYQSEWEKMTQRVAYWTDMDHPYITYDNSYIESVWWSLRQIWDKGLLYKGHKVVPYCPRCGTALSSHEVAQGYKDVTEDSVFVRFVIKGEKDSYFLAWTTTPWTLPSNSGLCVNEKETYVRVEKDGKRYILAEALVEAVFGEALPPVDRFLGKELEYKEYIPLFPYYDGEQKAFFVTCDGYVTLSDGTGIVHIAPAFGEDDSRVGKKYGLPFIQMVDEQGRFVPAVTPWAGVFVKDADPAIIEDLKKRGLLFKVHENTHDYPFCWRCDTPLLYYARATWFVEMTKVRDRLLASNDSVNWLPANIKSGRMGNFLENVIDWGISRERYWGTPLPIWECACGYRHLVGSIAELKAMGVDVPEDIELHKPYIDKVHLICPECGGLMKRVPEVIDCWYDSGSMPFAQWHYPFENKERFEAHFPADFISEAIDQTRGWFYTLLAISTVLYDRAPFQTCIVLGHVNDKDGRKMSKHLGNVVDPFTVLDAQGADAVRWYFFTGSAPWLPSRFSAEIVSEVQRKFMGTLWNTYAFFALYASIDGFDPKKYPDWQGKDASLMDRYILSRLNTLVQYANEQLDQYHVTETGRAMSDFIDDLSNWFLRRCRERYWGSDMNEDKIDAYMTLYTALTTFARLAAPFIPFITESMYQNLVCSVDPSAPESVHLTDYPAADGRLIDPDIEKQMERVVKIVVAGRSARNAAALKNRQPLSRMIIKTEQALDCEYAEIIADELNIKRVEFASDARAYTTYKLKPQLRTLGKKYGKLLPAIGKKLAELDGNEAMDTLLSGGTLKLDLDGSPVELSAGDVLSETANKQGYVAAAEGNLTIALDTRLTEELLEEGFMREIVSKVQTMRKEAGFEVTDHIRLFYAGNPRIGAIIEKYRAQIMGDTLSDGIAQGARGYTKDWNINGEHAALSVEKI